MNFRDEFIAASLKLGKIIPARVPGAIRHFRDEFIAASLKQAVTASRSAQSGKISAMNSSRPH